MIGPAGAVAEDRGEAFADAVELLLERAEPVRREAARARAERFGWGTAVAAFLAAHDAPVTMPEAAGGTVTSVRPVVPRGLS